MNILKFINSKESNEGIMQQWGEQLLGNYAKLIRLENCMIAIAGVLIGIHLAKSNLLSLQSAVVTISAFLIMAGGNVINNYFDRIADRQNPLKLNRNPFASGKISPKYGMPISALLFVLGIAIALLSLNSWIVLIACIATGALVAYTPIKHKGFLNGFASNFIISFLIGLLFIYGWSIFGKANEVIITGISFAFLFSFLTTMAREIVKGISDSEADRRSQIRTLASSYSNLKVAIAIATLILFISIVLSPLPFLTGTFSIPYLVFVLLTDVVLISAFLPLWFDSSAPNAETMKDRIRIGMILGLIAFLFGNTTVTNTNLIFIIGDRYIVDISNNFVISMFNATTLLIVAIVPIISLILTLRLRTKYAK